MKDEIIFEEKDNGAWIPRWASPCRWVGGCAPGNLQLTKKDLLFEPRKRNANLSVQLPIKNISSVKLTELGNGSGFVIPLNNSSTIKDQFGNIVTDSLYFKVEEPALWITHLNVNIVNEKGQKELKNTCKRCGKVWYLDADELQDLENRFGDARKSAGQMHSVSMVASLLNPMLAAQIGTTAGGIVGPLQQLQNELKEKSKCPECQSKNIERELVDDDEKISKKVITKKKVTKKKVVKGQSGGSLADELKKLNELKEQGILDEEEFKTAKRKLIEN